MPITSTAIINRNILQRISELRRSDAKALLAAGHYHGAYYLCGYAVECALKACVAKQVQRYDFPDKKLATEAFTHDLEKLMNLSGLGPELKAEMQTNKVLELNWAVVKDWSEAARYVIGISERQARDFYSACIDRKNGVLYWVRRRW
jgi:HEPN domain-containing protein